MRVESESNDSGGELKTLMAENLKLTKDLAFSIKKIRRYIFWLQISNWLKFLLIAVPLVVAALYLQPMISKFIKTYQEFTGPGGPLNQLRQVQNGAVNIQELLSSPQVQEFIKSQNK